MPNTWGEEVVDYQAAGIPEDVITEHKSKLYKDMVDAGVPDTEMKNYFGVTDPDMGPTKKTISDNLKAAGQIGKPTVTNAAAGTIPDARPNPGGTQQVAKGFLDSIEAGLQISVSGLAYRGKAPDMVLPDGAPIAQRLAAGIGQIAGDIPASIIGAVVGETAGPVVAAGAAFALPAAMRKNMMDLYEKGQVTNASDFWNRTSDAFMEAAKGFTIGAATGGAGKLVGGALENVAVSQVIKSTTQLAAEAAAMETVGQAMEGHLPDLHNFGDALLLTVALHGATQAPKKLMNIYAKTGLRPEQVGQHAFEEQSVLQDVAATNVDMPKAYEHLVDGKETREILKPAPEVESQMSKMHDLFNPADGAEVPRLEILKEPETKVTQATVPDSTEVGKGIVTAEKQKSKYGWQDFYTDYVDDKQPIANLKKVLNGEKPLFDKDNPYSIAQINQSVDGVVDHWIKSGTTDFATQTKTGESLEARVKKAMVNPGDEARLDEYLVAARHVKDLAPRGIETGRNLETDKSIVAKGEAQFGEAAKAIVDYQNDTLKYLKDSGVLSDKQFSDLIKDQPNRVPYYRQLEEGGGGSGSGKGNPTNPIKQMKGSEAPIIRPLESIVKDTRDRVRIAEQNRVIDTAVRLQEANPDMQLLERVKVPLKEIKITEKEMKAFFDEQGIEADPVAMTVLRQADLRISDTEVVRFKNGKPEIWRGNKGLIDALKGSDTQSASFITKVLGKFTTGLKFGAIHSPEFLVKNPAVDAMTAWIFEGAPPVLTQMQGLWSYITKDENFEKFQRSGGMIGAISDLKKYTDENIYELSKKTGLLDSTWNTVKNPWGMVEATVQASEAMTRLGVFKQKLGEGEGLNAQYNAALKSRGASLDFNRMGAKIRALNQIIPFVAVGVNGLDRFGRALKDDMVGVNARAFAGVTLPSLFLMWANWDDERVKNLAPWIRDSHWVISIDKWEKADWQQVSMLPDYMRRQTKDGWEANTGPLFKIPKPHELGLIYGSLIERTFEAALRNDPKAFDGFSSSITGMLPNYMPTVAAPFIQQFSNRSVLTGGKIIPGNLEGIMPEYQFTEYTTETAKALGKAIAGFPGQKMNPFASPIIMEQYIQAWSGGLGMWALKVMDKAGGAAGVLDQKPPTVTEWSQIPFVKAYTIRFPTASAKAVNDFYDKFSDSEKVLKTIQHLGKTGNFTAYEQELLDPANSDKLTRLKGVADAISNQKALSKMIYEDKDMSIKEKKQMMDGLTYTIIDFAKAGNAIYGELEADSAARAKAAKGPQRSTLRPYEAPK